MISPLLINFKLNLLTLTLFCLFLPATSFSISAIPVINCLWTQFSADRNKATALAVVFFSAGSIIWNLVFMALINPDNRIALIDDNGVAYFSSNVTAYLFQAANPVYFCGGLLFVIGSFLIEKRSKP